MGNAISQLTTISEFDHQTQLREYNGPKYSSQIDGVDSKDPELGPVYGTHVGTDGTPATEFQDGFKWSETENRYDIWSVFQKGKFLAKPTDLFVNSRSFKVQEGTKSGYAERKDGMIDRFDYVGLTYEESEKLAIDFGRGLISMGLKPSQNVSIFAANCAEWVIFLLGLYTQAMACVPLYPTLGEGSVEYILDLVQTECLVISTENINKTMRIFEKAPAIAQTLTHVIVFDSILDNRFGNSLHKVPQNFVDEMKTKYNIEVVGLNAVIEAGSASPTIPMSLPSPDSNAFLMFTSGTSGNPKGVQLTHRNVASCMGCVVRIITLPPAVRMFLYLPLQHVFSVVLLGVALLVGGSIYFSQPDVKQLASDMIACKPNILPTVPRVFVKFFQVIWAAVAQMPFYKRWYITHAYNYQLNQARQGLPLDPSYDQAVFQQFREKLGLTDCTIIVNGGAPCPPFIFEFMKILLKEGSWVVSGYGSTESTAGVAVSLPGDPTVGSIGSTIPSLSFRLADVPDLQYYHKDGKGELLLCGTTVSPGYFKNDEENEKAFLIDDKGRRWFRTGDVARINPGNNSLSIIDRKKSLIKLSQGEYIAIEKLTNTYSLCPYVNQIFIYGSPFKSCVVAIVSPVSSELYNKAKSAGWWQIDEVPVPGALTEAVISEFRRIGRNHQTELREWIKPALAACETQLNGFEKIRAIMVDTRYNDALGQSWNEGNDLMTATLKLRYQPLAKRYLKELMRLYESLGEPTLSSDVWW